MPLLRSGLPRPTTSQPPTGDYYSTLSPSLKMQVCVALGNWTAQCQAAPTPCCPSVDVSFINLGGLYYDPAGFALCVDCFQTAYGIGSQAGVMDQATFSALMYGFQGPNPPPSPAPAPQGGAPGYSRGGSRQPIYIQGFGGAINSQLAPAGLGIVAQGGGGVVQGGGPVPQPDIDAAESWIDSTSSTISTIGGQNLFTTANAQKSVAQLQQDLNAAIAKDFGNVGAPSGNAPGTVTGSFGNTTSSAFGWWDDTEWKSIVQDINGVAQDAATVGDDVYRLAALGNFVAQGNYPGGLQSYSSQLQTIRSMLEELRAARQTIATLQAQVNDLQAQVNDPNTGIASLQSQLASAQASVAAALQGCGA
jgi:hypothetical protein